MSVRPLGRRRCTFAARCAPRWPCAGDADSPIASEIDRLAAEVEGDVIAWRRDIHAASRARPTARRAPRSWSPISCARSASRCKTEVGVTGVVGDRARRPPGPGGRAARRHGRAAGHRAGRRAVRVAGARHLQRPRGRRDARLRPRRAHRDPDGRRRACSPGCATELPGTVRFIFQPAEEGAPEGERGGAELMVEQGALADPKPSAIFGLHVTSRTQDRHARLPAGRHHGQRRSPPDRGQGPPDPRRHAVARRRSGRRPPGTSWSRCRPSPARRVDITQSPVVVSIGAIHGGVRSNIIPDEVTMEGTIRALDPDDPHRAPRRIKRDGDQGRREHGRQGQVTIELGAPVTFNDPELTQRMVPTLERVAGHEQVTVSPPTTGAEDFSLFQQEIPGLFFFMGVTPRRPRRSRRRRPTTRRYFYVDESGLVLGVRAMTNLAWDYLTGRPRCGDSDLEWPDDSFETRTDVQETVNDGSRDRPPLRVVPPGGPGLPRSPPRRRAVRRRRRDARRAACWPGRRR